MSTDKETLEAFRRACRTFLEREAVPFHDQWEKDGIIDRSFWKKAGEVGFLGIGVDPEYGGHGEPDYQYAVILTDELIRAGITAPGIIAHNDVVATYLAALGNEEQKQRWLPGVCNGELIAAIAVTEPGGGSASTEITTTAKRDGDNYLVNGSKTFITNGINADLIMTAVKTDDGKGGQGISLLVIERDMPGLSRGPAMKKIGWHAADTAEIFFGDCVVPAENLLGAENRGNLYFMSGMTRERLSISTVAVASAEVAMRETLAYVKDRKAFGQTIGSFQYNRFMLAQLDTEVNIARIYLNDAVKRYNEGSLTLVDAARVKLWTTELQIKVADQCLQLHGGTGYMGESSIGKNWVNSRVQKIYGGTSEILQEMISRSMGL